MSGPIDLHAHSSVSDGTETPAQLVGAAVVAGLDVIAITDHDSTAGWSEAFDAARGTGLTVLPGPRAQHAAAVRQRARARATSSIPTNAALVAATARDPRGASAPRRDDGRRASSKDYPKLSWDDVLAQTTPGATVGRPHIADALVARGYVTDRSAAFQSILHWRGGYYQPH